MSRGLPSLAAVAAGVTLMGGCAGLGRVPQQSSPQASPTQPPASVQSPSAGAKAAQPGASDRPALSRPAAAHPSVKPQPAMPPAAGSPSTVSKRSDVTPESTPKSPAPVAQPAPTPLDIKSLETRLRETNAISVVSKLALQNQMEDLMERLRGFFQGRTQSSLAQLRQSYDLLVMKAIALLQDADPPLAGAIASSRESIWAVLSDPARLKSL